jgi:CheY-like chemotaxis protein
VQGILLPFESLEDLAATLNTDTPDLPLPCTEGVRDGEWLLATFVVQNDAISVAGRVIARDPELRLSFEERDWFRLCRFARGGGPSSMPPPARSLSPEPVTAPPGKRVLVVDEDATLRGIMCTMLKSAGITVTGVGSVEEATHFLAESHADLVVLDFNLPTAAGLELCQTLKSDSRFRKIPILFLTAHCTCQESREALARGADDIMAKPFRAPELRARVLGLLHQDCAN